LVLSSLDKNKTMRRDEALRQAVLRQMETVKGRYGESNPRYWGAFVFLGEAE